MYVCDISFQKYGMPFAHLLQNMRGRTKTARKSAKSERWRDKMMERSYHPAAVLDLLAFLE